MTTLAEERRAMYREQLLAAAEREFARSGFTDAKMTAIAGAANLSLATVYKTFPGKQEIWNELHTKRMDALLALVRNRVDASGSPLERLLAGIGAVADFLTSHDAYLDLSLAAGTDWLAPAGGEGVQSTVWSAGLATIAEGVRAAADAGELTELRPSLAAALVVSSLQVWLGDWVAAGRDRPDDEVVAELVGHLRRVLGRAG